MIVIKTVQFGLHFLGQQSFLRAELYGIRERLFQARDITLCVIALAAADCEAKSSESRRRSSSSAAGCNRRTRANSAGSSTRRCNRRPAGRIEEQNSDIHPLISHQIGRVAYDVISARPQGLRCCVLLA